MSEACRVCGCTEDAACPGGCWWVEPDLCSACVLVTLHPSIVVGRPGGWQAYCAGCGDVGELQKSGPMAEAIALAHELEQR